MPKRIKPPGHEEPKVIDMVLHCPACGTQHIDSPAPTEGWHNPPHRSHKCSACGYIWRPASVPTNGVKSLPSGKDDHPVDWLHSNNIPVGVLLISYNLLKLRAESIECRIRRSMLGNPPSNMSQCAEPRDAQFKRAAKSAFEPIRKAMEEAKRNQVEA